ncbi:hypothetical protein CHARACLAT_028024 [Characodon lateralis]|uniref:Uncharacterized protein n=1 Tax=Characodon lateralis TaxID=208331 RepID=A0ABU7DWJ3_9TELE|nr:hypothetical protein [Characodon lateralis]
MAVKFKPLWWEGWRTLGRAQLNLGEVDLVSNGGSSRRVKGLVNRKQQLIFSIIVSRSEEQSGEVIIRNKVLQMIRENTFVHLTINLFSVIFQHFYGQIS